MLATLILQWWFEEAWHEIGWRANTPKSHEDLRAHGAKMAAAGGRYRLVTPSPYKGGEVEIVHEYAEREIPPRQFLLLADGKILAEVSEDMAHQMVEAMREGGAPDLADMFADGFGFQKVRD